MLNIRSNGLLSLFVDRIQSVHIYNVQEYAKGSRTFNKLIPSIIGEQAMP